MKNFIKKLLITSSFLVLICFISLISILWIYSNKLPDYKFLKNYKPSVSSKLYSGNGELVIDFSSEKRIFIPYNAMATMDSIAYSKIAQTVNMKVLGELKDFADKSPVMRILAELLVRRGVKHKMHYSPCVPRACKD